jgi:hypothetical protein
MPFGRMVRVSGRDDGHAVDYIVALSDADEAIDLIKRKVGAREDQIKDVGRVSDELLNALNLMPEQFIRADNPRKRPFGI